MKPRLVAAPLLLSFSACTATIHRVNAPNIEGEIVGSDGAGLQVASDQGTIYRVPGESIADIDHPGNVLAVIGAAAIVLGGLVAITQRGSSQDQKSNLGPGLVISSAGFGLLLGGLVPYSGSRRAARAFAEAPPPVRSLPGEGAWAAGTAPAAPAPAAPPAPASSPSFSDSLLEPPLPLSDELMTLPQPPSPEPSLVPAADSPSRPTPARPIEKKRPSVIFKPAPPAPPLPGGGG